MQFIPHYSSSKGNLYRLEADSGSLLLEAGVSIKQIKKALDFRLGEVAGVLISHSHKDHSMAMADLLKFGMDVFCTEQTAKNLNIDHHRLHYIEPLQQFSIGQFKILPFPTEHDCPGSVGFLIADGQDKLVFATDTFFIKYKFMGLTYIAIECNYSSETIAPDIHPVRKKRLFTSHFSLKNVIGFLRSNDLSAVKAIYLLHMSPDNSDPEYFIREVQKATGKPVYIHT